MVVGKPFYHNFEPKVPGTIRLNRDSLEVLAVLSISSLSSTNSSVDFVASGINPLALLPHSTFITIGAYQ